MALKLSDREIKLRMTELRNLRHLHAEAIKRNIKQGKQIKLLKQHVHVLQELNKEKDKIIERFSLQLEELRTKVFGKKKKGKDTDHKPKSGGKKERDDSSYQREVPTDITKEETHVISACTLCQTTLTKKRVKVFYLEDIPFEKPQREAIKNTVEQGYCLKCKKWKTAIPIPFGKCVLGTGVRKYVCYLSIILRLSNQQIEEHIRDIHKINISQGEIQKILYKEADRLRPEFERLKIRVQNQKAQHYDETSWKVPYGKLGNYGWGMFGTETREAIFMLGKSRGGGNVKELHPKPIIGITDDYGAYKNAFVYHELCWSHPHRKFRDLAESEELTGEQKENCIYDFKVFSKIYGKMEQVMKTEFDYGKTRKYFLKKLSEFAKPKEDDTAKTKTLKTTLLKNKEYYLTCLKFPGIVPLDNNKAERGLRHLVIKRKISYGSKTDKGAEATSILASVLLSLKWVNPDSFFQKYFLEGC
jgi:transposase